MRSDSQGIQQLKAAEKRAEETISQARKRKALRLKKAKEEAQLEIQRYREKKETDFKKYESEFMGSKEDQYQRIEADTRLKIEEMNKSVAANKEQIIKYLLSQVFNIKPQLHQNLRLD